MDCSFKNSLNAFCQCFVHPHIFFPLEWRGPSQANKLSNGQKYNSIHAIVLAQSVALSACYCMFEVAHLHSSAPAQQIAFSLSSGD